AFPSSAGEAAPLLETGKFADRDLIAPFTFAVSKSDEELAREAEELAATVKPIYEFQPRGLDSARLAVHTFFATVDAAADRGPQAIIQAAREQGVTLTLGEAAYLSKGGKRRNLEKALDELIERTLALGATGPGVLQVEQAQELIIRRRSGDRIVGAHEVVTSEAHEKLVALRNDLVRRGAATGRSVGGLLGSLLRDGLVLSIFWVLMLFYRRETYRERRQITLIGCLFAIVIAGAAAVSRTLPQHPELVPLPFLAMLLTVLFNGRVSMIAALILSVVIALQPVYHDT